MRRAVNLFRYGNFRLHSGGVSNFKIDCEALCEDDWATLALLAVGMLPPFGSVEGVPTGGTPFARHLEPFATSGPLLIADDVYSTGKSMEQQRAGREALGIVVFCRTPDRVPDWITPMFRMTPAWEGGR